MHKSWSRFLNTQQVSVLGKLPSDKFPLVRVNIDMASAIFQDECQWPKGEDSLASKTSIDFPGQVKQAQAQFSDTT